MMRIHEALEIPEVTDLDQFITRLDNTDAQRVQRDMAQFVMANNVQERVDKMLHAVGQRFKQGMDMGRYIYGTFGSGKSHLMSVLGKMFERDEMVYEVGDPALRTLRANHPWIDQRKTLVVRLNMMGKKTLVRALYEAYERAAPDGAPPVVLTDEKRAFELFERDADRHGGLDAHIQRLVDDEVIPSPGFYHRAREGDLSKQLDLAAKLETWRNHGERVLNPEDFWVDAEEGFHRIASHAKSLGFDSVVWLVDELIIWIRGKAREEYVEQINVLSALVDHDAKAARPIPFFVAVAVQQDIRETCPDDLSEHGFHEQLGFISDRFSPSLLLEDQDLFEVAARRVLKPRKAHAEDYTREVDEAFRKHANVIRDLAGELEPEFVRKLYPFHPALLRALVDVTQALSRSRTSMAALYGLLDQHRELEVGQFVPVGALFEILFTKDNVDQVRERGSKLAQRFGESYDAYHRLEGKVEDAASSYDEHSADELRQLVRTVLLCQLSERPYFPDGSPLASRITTSTLLRLNQSDVNFVTERTGLSKVRGLFRTLATNDSQVQVTGDERDPFVAIKTERIDIEAVLSRARRDLQHADRFAYCRRLLDGQLGLKLGSVNQSTHVILWRGTKRRARVQLANVRKLAYAGSQNEFDPGSEELLLLVDYPFDEDPSCGRQDDIGTLQRARERKRHWTIAWLPEHFTDTEQNALNTAAAIELVRNDKRKYLQDYAPREAEQIARTLESHQANQDAVLSEAIRRVYFDKGEVHACSEVLETVSQAQKSPANAVTAMAKEVLDRRYPRHPNFKRTVRLADLSRLAEWVVRAAMTGESVELKSAELEVAEQFGRPLEMVYVGNSSVSRRTDGAYLSALHEAAGEKTEISVRDLGAMLSADGKEGFGFNDDVVQFFLFYLLQAEGYEAVRNGQGLTVDRLGGLRDEDQLVKAEVVDPTTWDHARAVASRLLEVTGRADLPSVPEQSKLSRDAATSARTKAGSLEKLLVALTDVCEWAGVDVGDSKRAGSVNAYIADLERIRDAKLGHATRVREIAAIHGKDRVEEYARLSPSLDAKPKKRGSGEFVDPLLAERAALTTIGHQRVAFLTVQRRGNDAQRSLVVTALQNLLRDPLSRPLADHADEWAKKAKKVAESLIGGGDDPPPPPPEDAVVVEAKGVTRSTSGDALATLLRDALDQIDASTLDLVLTVRKSKP